MTKLTNPNASKNYYLAVVVVDGGILPPPKAKCSPNRCTVDPKEVAGPKREE